MGNTNPGGTTKTPITAQAKDVTRPALRMRTSTFHREIGRRCTLTTRSRLSVGNGQHRLCRRDAFESYRRNCSPRDARDSKRQSVRCTEATVYCRDACLQCGAVSPAHPPAKTAPGRPAQHRRAGRSGPSTTGIAELKGPSTRSPSSCRTPLVATRR